VLRALPELAHWFGVRPWEVEQLTRAELDEMLARLKKLPPIGGTVMMQPGR